MYSNRICVCLLLLSAALGQADIYYCLDGNQQITRLKPAGFSAGYNVNPIRATDINQLNPDTDALIIFNASSGSTELAVQVSNFVRSGGRAIWFIKDISAGSNALNTVLSQRFGIMIDRSTASDTRDSYDGTEILPLWKEIYLGSFRTSTYNNYLQINRANATELSTRQSGENTLISSAYCNLEKGEIIFVCLPFISSRTGYSGATPLFTKYCFFSDINLERFENQKAFEEMLAWLSGTVQLEVQKDSEAKVPVHRRHREDLISRLVRGEGIDPSSEKGMALAGQIRELLKSARD